MANDETTKLLPAVGTYTEGLKDKEAQESTDIKEDTETTNS